MDNWFRISHPTARQLGMGWSEEFCRLIEAREAICHHAFDLGEPCGILGHEGNPPATLHNAPTVPEPFSLHEYCFWFVA